MYLPRYLVFIAVSIISLFSFSSYSLALPTASAVPGGIVLIPVDNNQIAESATYQNTRLAVLNNDNRPHILLGLPLSTKPGKHVVEIKNHRGELEKIAFKVEPKAYRTQHLTIKNKRKVNPYKDDMPRILSEKKRKNKARQHWQDTEVKADFIVPVDGRISGIFGLRRFFNNQPRRPHSGLDIAAPEGTPIKAVESGKVIEAGDFFFSGNVVYIDHGQGLITMYAHMNSIEVKTGDTISRGQVIGTVGETGRVTGPHLHLSVIANQTLVDPLLFLPQLEQQAAAYFKNN